MPITIRITFLRQVTRSLWLHQIWVLSSDSLCHSLKAFMTVIVTAMLYQPIQKAKSNYVDICVCRQVSIAGSPPSETSSLAITPHEENTKDQINTENHAVKQGVYFRLNTKVLENSSKQPDFACREIINSNWTGPIIVGEVKGEDQKDDKYICFVIGIHIVALQVTFYIITLVADGFYVMMEICSIPLPRDTTELRSYITNFDDFLTVLQYSSKL
ncbi:hypothetical protein INT48_006546 [Thamnidium elegans]|uniref:Uncharacterized protein n=1 Tax=Thamnidium elegans TaxID=101142 RepID=A0A8H7SKU2_9FUNG|nr:hypothetical protein INT48_006546 [Thamnidium elegans]